MTRFRWRGWTDGNMAGQGGGVGCQARVELGGSQEKEEGGIREEEDGPGVDRF